MTWAELHAESEWLAIEAKRALDARNTGRALEFYKQAAELELQALNVLDVAKARTRGITAVSSVALWFKAHEYVRAEQVAYAMLADPNIPDFARLVELVREGGNAAGAVRDYILRQERALPEGEKPTVFKLKTLTAKEYAEIQDSLYAHPGGLLLGSKNLKILSLGLVGWEGLVYPEGHAQAGQPIPFNLDFLPDSVKIELCNAITEGCELTGEQEKN
jgi:hypothetical protein